MTVTIPREDAHRVLALPMQPNDADAATIRDYLIALLAAVWSEGEGFSGKRPFGNSGWEWDLYPPLIKAGLVDGVVHADGYVDEIDSAPEQQAHSLILAAIGELGMSR